MPTGMCGTAIASVAAQTDGRTWVAPEPPLLRIPSARIRMFHTEIERGSTPRSSVCIRKVSPTRMDRQRWAWPTARSVHMSIQRTFVNSWTQIGGGSHSPNAATELFITNPTETMRAMALTLG